MNLSDISTARGGATAEVLDDQVFNTSGTWIKPSLSFIPADLALIELWGGGGGGADDHMVTPNVAGGKAGDYVRFTVPVSDLPASAAVAIGAGGLAGDENVGHWGGNTSFAGFTVNGGCPGMLANTTSGAGTGFLFLIDGLRRSVHVHAPGDGGSRLFSGVSEPSLLPGRSIHGGQGGTASGGLSVPNIPASAPGGGGHSSRVGGYYNDPGDGAPGRVRIRVIRGLNEWEVSEGAA